MKWYCPSDTIDLQMLGCTADPIISVRLAKVHQASLLMAQYELEVDGYSVKLPDTVCSGMWRLVVKTKCGCHTAIIGINCHNLQFAGTTEVTNVRPITKVCCDKETP